MANNPRQRGLELLIRTRGPDGQDAFEIKVYRPDRAFLRMRPVRRADLRIDENVIDEEGGRVHVLHLVDSGRHLQLSESEYAVWRRMDGRHSIQDLAAALVIEYGRFDFDEIRRTLGRLRGAGLIDERPPGVIRHRDVDTGRPVRSLARRIMELDVRREGVDGLFSVLHRHLRPLFGWPLGVLGAVVTVGGIAVYLAWRWGPGEVILLPTGVVLLVFLGLLPLFVALHELGHGVACKACGRRVDAVGLTMIDHLVPGVYVDVTDIYMASRGQRIAVALAGPLVNLLMAGGLALLAAALPTTRTSSLLWVAADANLALAVYTMWPFWGIIEDGYDALGEALRQPRLRSLAWAWLRARLRRRAPPDSIAPWRAVMYLVGVGATWGLVGVAWVVWLRG